jgi:glycine/D-amino acid oxidase-like deaminating enzyme/nitrite reductase/ring-hydroxylating ferredoxin subunit
MAGLIATPRTTSAERSLWLDEPKPSGYAPLDGDLDVDVAVIGGGITGLTTALLLKRDGARVAVVEAREVGSGVTGCTTAKVSALQGTVYNTISKRHGNDGAAIYAEASMAGVELVAKLAAEERIECGLERRDAFTYAASESERSDVEGEHRAACAAGLAVDLVEDIDTPFSVHGAVRLADQLQLQPVEYVRGLARAVHGDGSHVLEDTRAKSVHSGDPCRVHTERGTINAQQVIDAAHYPLLDRGLFFARLEPMRSYCIAARLRVGDPPRAMSISAGSPTRSLRSFGELIIVGGEGHAAGARQAEPERFAKLEEFARGHWDVAEVSYRWSAQDPVAWDHLPLVGPYHPRTSRLFVASAFQKWGLSGGSFAALILSDLIAGRENPWADRFNPTRIGVRGLPKLARLNTKVAIDIVGDRLLPARTGSPSDIRRGEARVVRDGIGKTGVYRDEHGTAHAVSIRCTHLGCLLRFNSAERSWDCPCHGSRFDVDGAVLEGPATEPLKRKQV